VERESEIDLSGVPVGNCVVDRGLGRQVCDASRVCEEDFDYLPGDVEVRAARWIDEMVVSR
jgi:hypothetical protein